jgi:hypothetical protein
MPLRPCASVLALALVALACAIGCSRAPEPKLPEPGTTAIYVTSHIDSPCELARIALAVDGQLQYKAIPPDTPAAGGAPKLVAKLRLSPGSHVLTMHATARCKGADSGEEPGVAALRDARSFLVGAPAAAVIIDLNTSEPDAKGGPRLDAGFRINGGELAPAIGPAGTIYAGGSVDAAGVDDRMCTGLTAPHRAICRAEAVLTRARERKDIVSVNCIHDKITQMRSYATIIDRARERLGGQKIEAAAPQPDAVQAHDEQIIVIAEERIKVLAGEVDYCSGHEASDVMGVTEVRVIERAP